MNLLSFWLFSSPVKFDMGAYTSNDESKFPVTLRISKTRLFLSAQNEDEPVLLKVSCPRAPLTFVTPHTSANDPKRQTPHQGAQSSSRPTTVPTCLPAPHPTSHPCPGASVSRICEGVKRRCQEQVKGKLPLPSFPPPA